MPVRAHGRRVPGVRRSLGSLRSPWEAVAAAQVRSGQVRSGQVRSGLIWRSGCQGACVVGVLRGRWGRLGAHPGAERMGQARLGRHPQPTSVPHDVGQSRDDPPVALAGHLPPSPGCDCVEPPRFGGRARSRIGSPRGSLERHLQWDKSARILFDFKCRPRSSAGSQGQSRPRAACTGSVIPTAKGMHQMAELAVQRCVRPWWDVVVITIALLALSAAPAPEAA